MSIQQFVGQSMQEAFASVREALGPEALILDAIETSDGFVVSAVAEDDGELSAAREMSDRDDPPRPPSRAPAADAATGARDASETSRLILEAAKEIAKAHDVEVVREEMQSIRCLVESQLARAGWNETTLGSPAKANIMRNLSAIGLTPDIVRRLLEAIDLEHATGQAWAAPMKALMAALPVVASDQLPRKGVVAVVGPTGAGKTTTIAKLATQCVQESGADRIAIVTLDNHRIGASEQMAIIGRLIGVDVIRPEGDEGLGEVADLIREKELVLVDTVGMGQHDTRLSEQLSRLRMDGAEVTTLLVLPANVEHDAMQEILDAYQSCAPCGCVLTKVDETATLGAAFSVLIRSALPLVYLSDGQRIPEDLHRADLRQSWLIKRAIEMMRTRKLTVSERYMAENFCRGVDARPA